MARIGVDVGGTKIAYGLFDDGGALLDRRKDATPIEADGPALSALILDGVRALIAANGVEERELRGIGIGMPSFLLYDEGYVCMTSAMVNVRDFPMRDWFARHIDVPVRIDKDSNLAALAELRYGAGRGSRNMIYMAVSTGIGCGLVLNGDVFRGSYGWAGEAGHMLITPDEGLECGCRNRGCFMSWASGRYIPQQLRIMGKGRRTVLDMNGALDGHALKQAVDAGDALALDFLDQMAHYIALCCFNVYLLLNVNLFVFGGGLTNLGPALFDRVRAEFDRYNHVPKPVDFCIAELKQDFGIIGAAELVKD